MCVFYPLLHPLILSTCVQGNGLLMSASLTPRNYIRQSCPVVADPVQKSSMKTKSRPLPDQVRSTKLTRPIFFLVLPFC
ncbi:hypothetical protein VTN31DRAFT_1285 [Thermomyces dupontii]|uniref:uncharacterized protein n=1 Tax=Talaromyces thermophilus TaxID=28565 RepID=UPI003743482B